MAAITWRFTGFLALAGLAICFGGRSVEAAAPTSKFEQAKIHAVVAYRRYYFAAQDASLLADKAVQEKADNAYKEWQAALDAAVDLDPHVREAQQRYEHAKNHPDDKDPDAESRRVEDLQIIRERQKAEVESAIVDRAFPNGDGADSAAAFPPAGAWNAEALAYGGGVGASSFGADYNTNLFGGRADFGVMLSPRWRLQLDVEGEGTGSYCTSCGSRSEVAYGGHLDYKLTPRFDVGAFGGLQNEKPTFGGSTSTNYFLGGEARYQTSWWLLGGQAGYFDVSSGPGTLDRAWFVEGRAKIALGRAFGWSPAFNPVLGVSAGEMSGRLSTTSSSASTTQWSVMLSQRLNGTPVTGFVGFHHFTNRVDNLGTVWDENIFKGGIKIDFSGGQTAPQKIETSQPFPLVYRLITNF